MKTKAYAKINLTLDILGKRQDGYHEIASVMQTISLFDEIELKIFESEQNEIVLVCSGMEIDCQAEKNLCYKAADIFLKEFSIQNKKIEIHIHKKIPFGAGLGGGSSDAAAVIRLLAAYFQKEEKTWDICSKIGADVPFFIKGGTQKAEGIGQKLTELKRIFEYWIVLAKPEKPIATAEIYARYKSDGEDKIFSTSACNAIAGPPAFEKSGNHTEMFLKAMEDKQEIFSCIGNDLEKTAIQICPEIEAIKKDLVYFGAKAACMTGSGSALFGLFDDYAKAVVALNVIKKKADFFGLYQFING